MTCRQERWKELGYTEGQIENHLQYERDKAKVRRNRSKKNNLENQDIIQRIKKDILGLKSGNGNEIIRIAPTNDGLGFYYHLKQGEYKTSYFMRFEEYNQKEFTNDLKYV